MVLSVSVRDKCNAAANHHDDRRKESREPLRGFESGGRDHLGCDSNQEDKKGFHRMARRVCYFGAPYWLSINGYFVETWHGASCKGSDLRDNQWDED